MNRLIKAIRSQARLSQEEFADRLGVTFATINRWENAKASPNKLAQTKLYDFCRENNVPICDMLLQKIKNEAEQIQVMSDRMILFHGSKFGISGTIAPISRSRCDFGAGFYMGTEPLQPLTLVCDYEKSRFYIVSMASSAVAMSALRKNKTHCSKSPVRLTCDILS